MSTAEEMEAGRRENQRRAPQRAGPPQKNNSAAPSGACQVAPNRKVETGLSAAAITMRAPDGGTCAALGSQITGAGTATQPQGERIKPEVEHAAQPGPGAAQTQQASSEPPPASGAANLVPATHDKEMATRFLAMLDAGASKFTFQFLSDGNGDHREVFHGTLDEVWPKVEALNTPERGVAVFVTINETDFRGRKAENIVRPRALFADADGTEQVAYCMAAIEACGATPSMFVKSGRGLHAYWVSPDIPREQFTALQGSLASKLGTDVAVKDLPRVMRLPGTLHLKDSANPKRVTLIVANQQRQQVSQLMATLGLSPAVTPPKSSVVSFTLPECFKTKRPTTVFASLNAQEDRLSAGLEPNIEEIRSAAESIPPDAIASEEKWMNFARGFAHTAATFPHLKEGLWGVLNAVSRRAHHYDQEDNRRRYERYINEARNRDDPITIATVFYMATEHGWQRGAPPRDAIPTATNQTTPAATYLVPLTMRELMEGDFPPPEWLIDSLVLAEAVNLMFGDGGVGKTLLALHMAVALAAGKPLFGLPTKQMPVLLVLAEDAYGVTKKRLKAICEHLGIDRPEDLPIEIWCLPGHDITLASVDDRGGGTLRPFYTELAKQLDVKPGQFVVLDALADVAQLSEEKRLAVNTLLKRVIGSLCEQYRATVLVLGHPSKTSMTDGSMYSGSTAFNNAVRHRLILDAPDGNKDPKRRLEVAKTNYGRPHKVDLFLLDTVFVTKIEYDATADQNREQDAVLSEVKRLLRQGTQVVRAGGGGQKPRDVAAAVNKEHGWALTPVRVLEILNEAERRGELRYQNAYGRQHAGFILSPEGGMEQRHAASRVGGVKEPHETDTLIDRASAVGQADLAVVTKTAPDSQTGS